MNCSWSARGNGGGGWSRRCSESRDAGAKALALLAAVATSFIDRGERQACRIGAVRARGIGRSACTPLPEHGSKRSDDDGQGQAAEDANDRHARRLVAELGCMHPTCVGWARRTASILSVSDSAYRAT